MKVAPKLVSGLLVQHLIVRVFPLTAYVIITPSFLPIHVLCATLIFSDQFIFSKLLNNLSAYFVILKNHCSNFFRVTMVPHLSQTPLITCSSAKTVLHEGQKLTSAAFL